jgi:hypothetical protein
MKPVVRLVTIAASIGLAACAAGGPMIYSESDPRTKIDAFYDDGAGDRDIKLIVFGDPFAMPKDSFARTVEADLRDAPTMHQPTRALLTPGPTAKPIYRLVYVFNPTTGMFGNAICRRGLKAEANEDFPPASVDVPARQGEVVAVAAFCVEYRAVSEVSGRTSATGPDDARFFTLTRAMMGQLFRPDVHWDTNGLQRPAG